MCRLLSATALAIPTKCHWCQTFSEHRKQFFVDGIKSWHFNLQVMGQTQSITENLIPNTLDTVQFEVIKHARVLSEIGQLTYEDFQKCLQELNEL